MAGGRYRVEIAVNSFKVSRTRGRGRTAQKGRGTVQLIRRRNQSGSTRRAGGIDAAGFDLSKRGNIRLFTSRACDRNREQGKGDNNNNKTARAGVFKEQVNSLIHLLLVPRSREVCGL